MELLIIGAVIALLVYADRNNKTVAATTIAATASAAGVPQSFLGTPIPLSNGSVPVSQSPVVSSGPVQITRLDQGTQVSNTAVPQPAVVPVISPLGSSQNQIGTDSGTVPVQSSFNGIYPFGDTPTGGDAGIPIALAAPPVLIPAGMGSSRTPIPMARPSIVTPVPAPIMIANAAPAIVPNAVMSPEPVIPIDAVLPAPVSTPVVQPPIFNLTAPRGVRPSILS